MPSEKNGVVDASDIILRQRSRVLASRVRENLFGETDDAKQNQTQVPVRAVKRLNRHPLEILAAEQRATDSAL